MKLSTDLEAVVERAAILDPDSATTRRIVNVLNALIDVVEANTDRLWRIEDGLGIDGPPPPWAIDSDPTPPHGIPRPLKAEEF